MPRRRRVALIVGGVVAVLVLVGAIAVYVLVLRDDAPPPVSTESAIAACQKVRPEVESLDDVDGDWVVSANPEPAPVEDGSFVGYRVQEELSGIGSNTAAGRTRLITGELVIEGTRVTDVSVTADLTDLQSDDARRDEVVRTTALETDEFPEASFMLTDPIELGTVPDDGVTIEATAVGELTLHGVTRPVELELEAQRLGAVIAVIGTTEILMPDHEITPPKLGPVLSIEDRGEIEVQLCLAQKLAA
jgi:polyisoprenoid-binding protein YceI